MNNFIDNDETNNKFILEINYLRNINNADNNMVPEKTKLTSKLFKNGKGNNYIIFENTSNILRNTIAKINLFYHNDDKFVCIYDSYKSGLLFNFD